jgi:HK97 family phage major capsid protein
MSSVRALLEERKNLNEKMKALTSAHPDTALPEDAQRKWDTHLTERDTLEKRIGYQSTLDEDELRMAGRPIGGGAVGIDARWNQMMSRYSISKAILHQDSNVDAGLEVEVSKETERRTGKKARGLLVPDEAFVERRAGQVVGTDALGGVLDPDRYRGDLLIDRLRAASVLARLGVSYLNVVGSTTVLPKMTAGGNTDWIGENQDAPAESELGFGSVTLSQKTVASQASYSRRMLMDATPSIDALLRDDIAKNISTAIDVAAINGTGGLQPLGLLRMAGIKTISLGATGAAPTIENLIDLCAAPDIANATGSGPAWLTTGTAVAAIQKLKDGDGRYLFLSSMPSSLLGYPLIRSSSVPGNLVKGAGTGLSAMIFSGDWSSMLIGRWGGGGVDLLADPYTAGASGRTKLYAFADADVQVRHLESFAVFVDVKTS